MSTAQLHNKVNDLIDSTGIAWERAVELILNSENEGNTL